MSYLLTEIALEMLGYKFYDTNGVFHLTNFQQPMTAVQHPDEPSLEEFINQPSTPEPNQNGHNNADTSDAALPVTSTPANSSTKSAISVDFRTAPIRALAKMMANEAEKVPNGGQEQQSKPTNSSTAFAAPPALPKMSTKPRRTPTKALSKILEYESFTIRSQLSQRLEAALREKATTKGQQTDCINEEKKKLLEDADDMHKFRVFLEERLRRTSYRPYSTYVRTFGKE